MLGQFIGQMFDFSEPLQKQFVSSGLSIADKVNRYRTKRNPLLVEVKREGLDQLYYEICPFVPEIMRPKFVQWLEYSDLLELLSSQSSSNIFPIEKQTLAEEVYLNWVQIEEEIRDSIDDPEQCVSFGEISSQLLSIMQKTMDYIYECCSTKNVSGEAISSLLDSIND